MTDIAKELREAALAFTSLDCRRARSMGLFNPGLLAVNERHHPFGTARITDCGSGLFEPDPDGKRALIVPVYENDDLVDLVAFQTATAEHWLSRLGIGWALGLEDGLERYRWGDPLPIHKTPLDWLKAAGDALCILDWSAPPQCWARLRSGPSLQFTDDTLRLRVRNALVANVAMPPMEVLDAA